MYIMISQLNPQGETKQNSHSVKSVLINMDLFVQKCLCVQYPEHTASERACGESMGLLLGIKARFDLRLPLGRASALG